MTCTSGVCELSRVSGCSSSWFPAVVDERMVSVKSKHTSVFADEVAFFPSVDGSNVSPSVRKQVVSFAGGEVISALFSEWFSRHCSSFLGGGV